MSKHNYRFGWDYFATKQIRFVKTRTDSDKGLVHMSGIIRDTHQTWDVASLYPVFLRAQKVAHVFSTQPTTPSEAQDSAPSSEPDTRTGGAATEEASE